MKSIFPILVLFLFFGCRHIAVTFTKPKKPEYVQTVVSVNANKFFWDNFHLGNYSKISQITDSLNIVLQQNPKDLITTTHLGFVHIWALAERQRLEEADPQITNHIILSKRYFSESNKMNPRDLRVLGFLADLTLAEGSILQNDKLSTDGYFIGLKSIRKWPQFNKFTLGYFFSALDTSDINFKKGLDWQYSTIDDCACEKNTRKTDYIKAINKIKLSNHPKIYRACWNSWIAPHNWEGYCLNWGDMLTKAGKVNEAVKIYNLAKQSDTYTEWPFSTVLEERIANVKTNVSEFNKPIDEQNIQKQKVIMFNSSFACMGCHQMSKNEYSKFGHVELDSNYYFLSKAPFSIK